VLAQGTGGVSCFVIQLASAFGATVIATSSSDAKLAQAKKMGAKFTVNYRTHENWGEEVLRLTDGKGADVVVEVAGASTIEQSIKAAAPGGVVALVGFLSGSKKTGICPFTFPSLLLGSRLICKG
jgi:NADPH:quinone reductase-like Zn-dependent oxidoreductase